MSDERDFEFVAAMTRGFDKENPNHVRAARLLLNEIDGMDGPHVIVILSRVLDMTSSEAFGMTQARQIGTVVSMLA